MHSGAQWVTPRIRNVTLDVDSSRFHLAGVAMDHNSIVRLKQWIFCRIPRQRFCHICAKDFHCAIFAAANDLRRIHGGFGSDTAGEVDCISEMDLARSRVLSGLAHFALDPNFWSRLEIVPTEDPNGIERLEFRGAVWIRERRSQIKTFYTRTEIRWI